MKKLILLILLLFITNLGYSKEDRISNIKRIMLSTYVLEKNNIIPIVCNISPFENLRDFARDKFDSYHEIYLNKNISIAKQNDVKGVYKNNHNYQKEKTCQYYSLVKDMLYHDIIELDF